MFREFVLMMIHTFPSSELKLSFMIPLSRYKGSSLHAARQQSELAN